MDKPSDYQPLMLTPRFLTNVSILVVAVVVAASLSLVFSAPYTGFSLVPTADGKLAVDRTDSWIADQGLVVGDQIVGISGQDGRYKALGPKHFPRTSFESREYYESRKERLGEFAEIYDILSQRQVDLHLTDGRVINLVLDENRPFSSVDAELWYRFCVGLISWIFGLIVWVWRPNRPETAFLMLSGFGNFTLTLSAFATIYHIEMYFPDPHVLHFLTLSVGFGDFLYMGFGTCVLYFFPQRLARAKLLTVLTIGFLVLYGNATLLNDWNFDLPVSEQFLYYTYNETYLPMPFFFGMLVVLSVIQYRMSQQKPVERAQTLWVALAWVTAPAVVVAFYILPAAFDNSSPLTRTWTTTLLSSSYLLVLLGVARIRLFNLEQHVPVAAQWFLVTFVFICLDIILVSMVNLNPQISTGLLLIIVLWVYFPVRQWIYQVTTRASQQSRNEILGDALTLLADGSLNPVATPDQVWRRAVSSAFDPLTCAEVSPAPCSLQDRGQSLVIADNRFSPALKLEYAASGVRLFNKQDVELANTLSEIFVRLYESRDAYLSGQREERERIMRDLHDDVASRLLSMVHRAKDPALVDSSQEALKALRETIYNLEHREPVSLVSLLSEIRFDCVTRLTEADQEIRWSMAELDEQQVVTGRQNINLRKVFQEICSNAMRHGERNTLSLELQMHAGVLKVAAINQCADAENPIPGKGLANIETRVREMGGETRWLLEAGRFRLDLSVPIE